MPLIIQVHLRSRGTVYRRVLAFCVGFFSNRLACRRCLWFARLSARSVSKTAFAVSRIASDGGGTIGDDDVGDWLQRCLHLGSLREGSAGNLYACFEKQNFGVRPYRVYKKYNVIVANGPQQEIALFGARYV